MKSLHKINATLKTGQESLIHESKETSYNLIDFWKWSVSDLLSNATRGRLAEFIVATATGVNILKPRDEWAAFDLITPDGIKIEVKSAAYIQSWDQKQLSKISFSTKAAYVWDSETNRQSVVASRSADVYVFCLLHHDIKQTCDPLNLDHWEFYVLATQELNKYTRSVSSITLRSLRKLVAPINYSQLKDEVRIKHTV
jgi:hypothetical protein